MWGSQGWNQWALQPAMFNDVPHEQIDWAELAKQWIQMQQTQPADAGTTSAPLPPPPPQSLPPVALPPPPGHMTLLPEEFVDGTPTVPSPASPLLKPAVPPSVIPEHFVPERIYNNETAPPFVPSKAADNSFWSKSQWDDSGSGDVDERMWPAPTIEPVASLMGGKETFDYGHMHDNPPLAMQSIDYNHMSDFSYSQVYPTSAPIPESHYDQYWSQVNAAPAISPIFLKKERSTANLQIEEDSSHIDAAKRKQLPAWIRDGLEKMEQERLKRLEKERAAKEKAEKIAKTESLKKDLDSDNSSATALPSKSKFDSESEEEEEVAETSLKNNSPIERPPPSPVEDLRTEEEKKQDLMLRVRRMLTEVLLSVTNSEMAAIAQEMYKKAMSKAPARQLASSTSQSSVASGLRGLATYGTESEASEEEDQEKSDSEEELYRKIKEKKKLFAVKERKIIAELERREREEKEAERINNERNMEKKLNKDSVSSEKLNDVPSDVNNINHDNFSASDQPGEQISRVSSPEATDELKSSNDSSPDKKQAENIELVAAKIPKVSKKEESNSSDSSSSSSDSDSESGERHKNKTRKDTKKIKVESKKTSKKDKNSGKHESRRKRSKSKDSDSSGKHKRERSREKNDRKSSSHKKKKKYKRSDSSSSSSSSSHRKGRSSRYESSHNHRDRRSHSYDDRERKRKRSISPSRSHRKSDGSHSYHSSRSHRYDDDKYHRKHRDEKKHREFRKSPSPWHSSRLPRKYRSSRSLSSESESSGKKLKKSRNR